MIGTEATETPQYASDFAPAGGSTVVPDPVYLPVGMAEGGIVNVSGLQIPPALGQDLYSRRFEIGMGFPGGAPMPNSNDTISGALRNSNPLQQYGGYLEQKYGDPNFDQKKDQFLQEVQQKEQQTFGGGAAPPTAV